MGRPELVVLIIWFIFNFVFRYSKSVTIPIVKEQSNPNRFFSSASAVLDFPYGNIDDVALLVQEWEVVAVMYYAPWSTECVHARDEFEKAASYLYGKVLFVGVNCWYNKGTCRQNISFHSFPTVYLYYIHLDGFHYSGILSAEYLINFVQMLLHPWSYASTTQAIVSLAALKDNVFVGYFDFAASPQPPGFLQFHYASMRYLEKDPSGQVAFAVVTNRDVAHHIGLNESRHCVLIRTLNESLLYPQALNFTASAITQWLIYVRQKPLVHWLAPKGYKSLALSAELARGPALIVFIQNYPLIRQLHQTYAMVREVSFDYRSCSAAPDIQVKNSIFLRWMHFLELLENVRTCANLSSTKPATAMPSLDRYILVKRCCSTVMVGFKRGANGTACDICLNYEYSRPEPLWNHCDTQSLIQLSFNYFNEGSKLWSSVCSEIMPAYLPGEFVSICCSKHYDNSRGHQMPPNNNTATSFIAHAFFGKNDVDLLKEDLRSEQQCSNMYRQLREGWMPKYDIGTLGFGSPLPLQLHGLGCNANRSLNFYAVDIRHYPMFLNNLVGMKDNLLGGNHFASGADGAFIVDVKEEKHYFLNKPVTRSNIANFVDEFTRNMSSRHLRSSSDRNAHYCAKNHFCVTDLTKDDFLSVVMDPTKDVVVYHFAPWCGYCASFSHVYLTLAWAFRHSTSIKFVRINAYTNDLPWPHTVDMYPSVVLYPAHSKDDSVTFSEELTKDLPSLINFVLRYSSPSTKLHTVLQMCSKKCLAANAERVSKRLDAFSQHITAMERRRSDSEREFGANCENLEDDKTKSSSSDQCSRLQMYIAIMKKHQLEKEHRVVIAKLVKQLLSDDKSLHSGYVKDILFHYKNQRHQDSVSLSNIFNDKTIKTNSLDERTSLLSN